MYDQHRRGNLWCAENNDPRPSGHCPKQQLQGICSGLGVGGLYGSETASWRKRWGSSDLKGEGVRLSSPGLRPEEGGEQGVRGAEEGLVCWSSELKGNGVGPRAPQTP